MSRRSCRQYKYLLARCAYIRSDTFHHVPPLSIPSYICPYVRIRARECTKKKRSSGYVPQNRDKSGNMYPSYKYDDPSLSPRLSIRPAELSVRGFYPYLGQEQKGIERFSPDAHFPGRETRDASVRQMNFRRLLYRSVYPPRDLPGSPRTLVIFTDVRIRALSNGAHTRAANAERVRQNKKTSIGSVTAHAHVSHPLTRM